MLDPTQVVLILALISSLSRAGLNIIDRYQIGMKNLSIRSVNFWNNAIPAVMMILAVMLLGRESELATLLLGWRTAIFAGVVQLVAYTFSYAFRYLSVNQVTVAAKLSDLFIPITMLLTTGYWDWKTFGFAMTTTLVCLPILRGHKLKQRNVIKAVGLLMCFVLVAQASLSPLLARMNQGDWQYGLLFATAVIAWRTLWSLPPFFFRLRTLPMLPVTPAVLICSRVFVLRCVLAVVTQVTFILAVSSTDAAVAWPLLNAAGLFAMVLASILLKERQAGLEKSIVVVITALAAIRFAF